MSPANKLNNEEHSLFALRGRAAARMDAAARSAARLEVAKALHKSLSQKSDILKACVSADVWSAAVLEESVARRNFDATRRGFRGATIAARAAASRAHAAEGKWQVRERSADDLLQKKQAIRSRQLKARQELHVRTENHARWEMRCRALENAAEGWRHELAEREMREMRRAQSAGQRKAAAAKCEAEALRKRMEKLALAGRYDKNADGVLDAGEFTQLEAAVTGDGHISQDDFLRLIANN